MAKKVSKFFRIGVEGDTCDGRIISASDIQEMAETYDQRVYGCRINLEHLRGLLPDGVFKRYGDVVELKAEKIDDDSALNGKWALFAKITPTDDLIAMNKAAQKVYTSMEIQPNFANTGKCYLVGLAVTDEQTVSDARLRNAIKTGMAETNAELYDYRLRQIAAGFKTLADVPDAEEIDGENVRIFHYLSAVTAMATATLYERYRGVEATGKGDKKADSVETTIDDLWRDMRWSVSRLQDKPRCIVGQL